MTSHVVVQPAASEVSALQLELRLHALLTRAIAAGADTLETVLDPCAQALAAALRAEALGIWTVHGEFSELRLRAGLSRDAGMQPLDGVAIGRAHADALACAAHPAIFRDPRFEAPLFTPPLSGPERHVTLCPLVIQGARLVGVVAVIQAEAMSADAEAAVCSVSDLLAIAIDRQHAAERLREREDGLGTLISTAPDGIVLMDVNSRIVAVNPSLEKIFGYHPGELVGENVMILMPERFRSRHSTGVRRYRETGEKRISWHGIELAGLHKDGSEFPIEISFGEYMHNGGVVFTGFIRDITQRKRTEERDRRRQRAVQATAVYVGTSLVALQSADVILPVLPVPAWSFTALVILALLGLPLVVGLAWGIAVPGHLPVGDTRSAGRPADRAAFARALSFRHAFYATSVVALLALSLFAWRPLDATRPVGEQVIAVLPFESIDETVQGRRIAAGLTEEVVTTLAEVDGLRVLSRRSVAAMAVTNRTVAALARDLEARYVLEGSIRMAGGRVRVSLRLALAGRDRTVWAESFEAPLDDPFALESGIAGAVARALEQHLLAPDAVAADGDG
jgi:PAS domain S-box-containing protein